MEHVSPTPAQSLTTGRPPSFTRDYIDCKYPALQHIDILAEEEEEEEDDENDCGCPFLFQSARFDG